MQQRFLLQILLLAQHVSGTTTPIIRSSRVLCSGCCLWYFVLWFSSCWSGAELRVICPVCRMLRHLVGILFPHINDDARSKSHQRLLDGCTHLEDFFRLWFFFRVVTLFNLGMIIFNASEVTVHVPRAEEVMIWRSTWVWGRGTQRKCGSTRLLLK